ncbi:MAG: glycosyl hydrolase family 28-related protein, partial [Petrimonas sp.]
MSKTSRILSILFIFLAFHIQAKDYNIADFGAKPDGKTINTRTIQRAIDYVSENGGGRLIFQEGNFVTGTIYLKSNVTLHLEAAATLLGSTNPLDFV